MPDDPQPEEKPKESFEIPKPKIDAALVSDEAARQELITFAVGWDKSRIKWDWRLRTGFKIFLFVFVIVLNCWWAWHVLAISQGVWNGRLQVPCG